MERGNTKHGPVHDEEMARETQGMVQGGAHRAHAEEWREPEPVDGAIPPVRRGDGANPLPAGLKYELRTALARVLTRDMFPTDRDGLTARLADTDVPQDVTERVAALPGGTRFAAPRDVLVALGVNSPETRDETAG
jgi:hypothetical protein